MFVVAFFCLEERRERCKHTQPTSTTHGLASKPSAPDAARAAIQSASSIMRAAAAPGRRLLLLRSGAAAAIPLSLLLSSSARRLPSVHHRQDRAQTAAIEPLKRLYASCFALWREAGTLANTSAMRVGRRSGRVRLMQLERAPVVNHKPGSVYGMRPTSRRANALERELRWALCAHAHRGDSSVCNRGGKRKQIEPARQAARSKMRARGLGEPCIRRLARSRGRVRALGAQRRAKARRDGRDARFTRRRAAKTR